MRKETKKEIIKDIIELQEYCYKNNLKTDFIKKVEDSKQNVYCSQQLFISSMMNKKKEVLDKIREIVLEEIVYA